MSAIIIELTMSLDCFDGGIETIYEEPHILDYHQFHHLQMLEDAYWNEIIREPSDQYIIWFDRPTQQPYVGCFSIIIKLFKLFHN